MVRDDIQDEVYLSDGILGLVLVNGICLKSGDLKIRLCLGKSGLESLGQFQALRQKFLLWNLLVFPRKSLFLRRSYLLRGRRLRIRGIVVRMLN